MNSSATLPNPYPAMNATASLATPDRLSLPMRVGTLAAVILPFLSLVLAAFLLWGWGFSWVHLGLLVCMYSLTGLGITVGFHRLFTHRSFETHRAVEVVLAALGCMALQGSLLDWVAVHRRHHQLSDRPDDPHSPHTKGRGFFGFMRGLWHSHTGWLFTANPPDLGRYVKDLRQVTALRVTSDLWLAWVALGLAIPTALGGLLTGAWIGALLGLIWGGLVRIFLVHHVTWSVNSVCHLWGSQPFKGNDESRNNFLVGVLAFGEGWHNNHHAFPTSARHGLRWWQIDTSYLLIRTLAFFRLAWDVKLPASRAASV